MADEGFKRKLTAILSADAVGYSRLMAEDEVATVKTMASYREIMSSLIRQHRGRVVDSPGDNVLAEFSSVVDAVQCAVAVQHEFQTRNAELPENRRMEFRIGINLGDVIDEEDRLYGDGVNISARLEALAEAGGVCISGTAFDQVKGKLSLGYQFAGEQTVKNIPDPIRVYKVLMDERDAGKLIGVGKKAPKSRWAEIAAIVVFVVIGLVIYQFYVRSPAIEPASVEKMAFPLPDKASIAVLPFANISGDPEQEYFNDGMTDDLITDLSKVSGLFVIARNSVFTYKGKLVKVQQVAEDLGVRYVLEGSVRRVGEKLRINAQLIDATSGHHLWAERYDGNIGDVFTLQDKITRKIVAALAVKLTVDEQEKVTKKETDNIAAYEAFLKGWLHYRRWTREDWDKAVLYFKKAIELDSNYGQAHAVLGSLYFWSNLNRWALDVPLYKSYEEAKKYLQLAMKNPTSQAYWLASQFSVTYGEHEKAIAEAEQSIAIDPNKPENHVQMAYSLTMAGMPEEAIGFAKRAMRLDPHYPAYYLFVLGLAHFALGELEEAVNLFERTRTRNPEYRYVRIPLIAAYAHLGREQEAKDASYEGEGMILLSEVMYQWPFKDQETADLLADGLRKAGWSE